MPDIQAQTADGVIHSFPDGTKPEVMDAAIQDYVKTQGAARDTRNATETNFEKTNKMGQGGRELTSLATGVMSGASGLPETMNPVSDAVKAASQPRSLKDILLDPENFSPGAGIASNLYHAGKEFFGGGQPGEDPGEARAHAVGSVLGQTAGMAGGGEAEPLGAAGDLAGRVKAGAGRALRTSDNALKPWVEGAATATGAGAGLVGGGHYGGPIEGAAAGGFLGNKVAKWLAPNHPDAVFQGQKDMLEDSPNKNINAEKALTGQVDKLATSPNRNINAGKLADQVRAAKEAAAPPQGPRVQPWQGPMPDPNQKANPILTPPKGRTGTTGPEAPTLIKSVEDWNAHDQRQKIMGREASEAGTFHAARGSTKNKLSLQEKIRRKQSQ